jgi:hypothetical protein
MHIVLVAVKAELPLDNQCCASGFRRFFYPWLPDPGSGMDKELRKIFWVKMLKFFDADPGWKNSVPGSGIKITQH